MVGVQVRGVVAVIGAIATTSRSDVGAMNRGSGRQHSSMHRSATHSVHAELVRASDGHRAVGQESHALAGRRVLRKVASAIGLVGQANGLSKLASEERVQGDCAGDVELVAGDSVHIGELPVEEAKEGCVVLADLALAIVGEEDDNLNWVIALNELVEEVDKNCGGDNVLVGSKLRDREVGGRAKETECVGVGRDVGEEAVDWMRLVC